MYHCITILTLFKTKLSADFFMTLFANFVVLFPSILLTYSSSISLESFSRQFHQDLFPANFTRIFFLPISLGSFPHQFHQDLFPANFTRIFFSPISLGPFSYHFMPVLLGTVHLLMHYLLQVLQVQMTRMTRTRLQSASLRSLYYPYRARDQTKYSVNTVHRQGVLCIVQKRLVHVQLYIFYPVVNFFSNLKFFSKLYPIFFPFSHMFSLFFPFFPLFP